MELSLQCANSYEQNQLQPWKNTIAYAGEM